jgi:hypothetical protein
MIETKETSGWVQKAGMEIDVEMKRLKLHQTIAKSNCIDSPIYDDQTASSNCNTLPVLPHKNLKLPLNL